MSIGLGTNIIKMECEADRSKPYAKGEYNKIDDTEQWIRLSEGCPNGCPFCREGVEISESKTFEIPELVRNKVKILDMNLLCRSEALEIIRELGRRKVNGKVIYYELSCGVDYRFLNQELAVALKQARFKNIRLAWDFSFSLQKEVKEKTKLLLNAGYSTRDIMIFVICNWKTTYEENLRKMELCKIWNFQMADCYFDNQLFPKNKADPEIKPIHWTLEHMKDYRKKVRKHNQLVNFRIDPEQTDV